MPASGWVMGTRILLIEDEAGIADFVVRGLREEGYTVEHAADGHDGWHRLSTESRDVILLDWWLPGVDGLQLLRRFRQPRLQTPSLFHPLHTHVLHQSRRRHIRVNTCHSSTGPQ